MRITLPTGTPAEVARPTSGEATGGLVLWPDIMGLRPLFDGHAQRLADVLGRVVVAPELYPGEESMPIEQRHARAASFSDADKLADGLAAADATGFEQVVTLGFCMGGMYAMKSLASDRFTRAAAFYGMVRVPEAWSGGSQGDAIDVVAARAARGDLALLCIFGTNDPWCPIDQIDEIEAVGAQVVRYDGADHGWAHDSTRENYREADATDAWAKVERFLAA
jgi:carboxymethylenebutenolidase